MRLQLEYNTSKSEYRGVDNIGHEQKKRKVAQMDISGTGEDRDVVGDERDDTGAMKRDDDGISVPSLGGIVRSSDDVVSRETMKSSGRDHDDLDVIPPSILLAMMKNHTVI